MAKSRAILAGAILVGAGLGAGGAHAAGGFYDGNKTITFIVGVAPGGGADLGCRLIADSLGKHIPGNPSIIVKNMPGTNNLVGLNYVGKEVKKDGLTAFCGVYNPNVQLFKDPNLQTDLTKFNFIGGYGAPNVMYVRADISPGLKTREDFFKASGVVLGGFAVDSLKDMPERLAFSILGVTDYKYVTGFTGDATVRAAVQQKFVNAYTESMAGYTQVVVPSMVKTGEVLPLFQSGILDAKGDVTVRDPRLPDVPTLYQLAEQKTGKAPSGVAWDLYDTMAGQLDVAGFAVMLPPDSPPDAVAAMRGAIDPLNQDPDFTSGADRLLGAGTREQSGAVVSAAINRFLNMPAAQLDYYKAMIESGKNLATQNKSQAPSK